MLKVEKVAWRKIEWKTCLLEGLKASREHKKPLMLWIFIIDLKCGVRYGLFAVPAALDEVVEQPAASARPKDMRRVAGKVRRLQVAVKRRQANGGNLSEIRKLMMRIGPLLNQRKLNEAEALLDEALKLLEPKSKPTNSGSSRQ